MRALTLVKQPHSRQRTPVWCSQAAHVCRRCWWTEGVTVLSPEPRNRAIDLAAEKAMRSKLGLPVAGCATGAVEKPERIEPLIKSSNAVDGLPAKIPGPSSAPAAPLR